MVAGVAVLVFWLSQRAWRDPMQVFGLQVAGLTALAVFSPHLIWLAANDFESLGYAMSSSLAASLSWPARVQEVARWWGDQMLNRAMPAWVLLAVFWMMARRRRSVLGARAAAPAAAPCDPGRALLLAFGFTPLVFVSVMTLATGSHIQLHWGTPYLLFAVPAVMELLRGRAGWRRVRPREALVAFMLIQLALMARMELTSPLGAGLARRAADWRYFDSQALAQTLHKRATLALGGPVRVISGPPAEAGALALRLPEQPLVLIDGQPRFSPWVPAGLAGACGALELSLNTRPEGFDPVGADFPGLYWRVRPPVTACGA